jgi:hypothetical protein
VDERGRERDGMEGWGCVHVFSHLELEGATRGGDYGFLFLCLGYGFLTDSL